MSQIEGSLGSESLAGQIVFAAARRSPSGAGGVRSAMARAGQLLLAMDDRLDVYADVTPAPAQADHERAPADGRHGPARRRSRRYAERRRLLVSG